MFNQQQLQQAGSGLPNIDPTNEAKSAPKTSEQSAVTKPALENTDIYYMPENFQKNNQVAGHNINVSGVVVLILGILFLIILGGGLYIYLIQPDLLSNIFSGSKSNQNTTETAIPTETVKPVTPVIETSVRPIGSPKDVYLAFRSELELADTVDKYLAVFVRYGTAAKQANLNSQKANLDSVGGQGDILAALRGTLVPVLDGTENISENITDQKAILTVSKTSGRSIGTITLLPENGQWKISDESWAESINNSETENSTPTASADDDQDGLSNLEETLLGTNLKIADSDGDNYKDAEEFNNGYNPAGAGKLSANASLGTYLNTTFNFSLLYPVKWDRTIASTDDSVIFTAPNKQFIQILVQPNSNQEDIVNWYRSTFNVVTVPNNQLVINETWDGVKTTDGLTTYLTNKDKSYIFVITYNLGSTKVLDYKNIFDMMVRNLKLGA
ncbi:MAG: hypothetical protein NTY12_00035 [Candidatus Falkowbacteria bacterium]|nr:hypothetical protein [Candidatus Falkowbacteria bacterium]